MESLHLTKATGMPLPLLLALALALALPLPLPFCLLPGLDSDLAVVFAVPLPLVPLPLLALFCSVFGFWLFVLKDSEVLAPSFFLFFFSSRASETAAAFAKISSSRSTWNGWDLSHFIGEFEAGVDAGVDAGGVDAGAEARLGDVVGWASTRACC